MDVLGAPDRERSREIGRATYAVLDRAAAALLDAGVGMVLESNFARGVSEPFLAPLVARSRAVLVHCDVPPRLARERYARRARHPGHFDELNLGAWRDERAEPLDLDIPTLAVDTSDGYRPPLEDILAFVLGSPRDS